MQVTPTEQRILNIIRDSGALITTSAIAQELQWSERSGPRNVRKYLDKMQAKGLLNVVPQKIEIVTASVQDMTP